LCEEVNEKTNIINHLESKFKMKKEKNRRVFPFCAIRAVKRGCSKSHSSFEFFGNRKYKPFSNSECKCVWEGIFGVKMNNLRPNCKLLGKRWVIPKGFNFRDLNRSLGQDRYPLVNADRISSVCGNTICNPVNISKLLFFQLDKSPE